MNKYDKASSSLFLNPWVFFGVTFAWTWAFWGVGILLKISMESAFGFGLLFLGVMGPMVTGIGFTYLTKNKAGRRRVKRRPARGHERAPWVWDWRSSSR